MSEYDHLYQGWHVTIVTLVSDHPLKFQYPNAVAKTTFPAWPKWLPYLAPIAKVGKSYIALQRGAKTSKDYQVAGVAALDLTTREVRDLNFQTHAIMEHVHKFGTKLEHDPVFLALLVRYMPCSLFPDEITFQLPAFEHLMGLGIERLEELYRETGDRRYERAVLARHEVDDALRV